MTKEWTFSAEAWVEEQIEKKARNGEIHRYAKERGLSYGDAMIELADKEWKPFQEIRSRNATKPVTLDEDEIDRRARSYADKHSTTYELGLDAVIGPTPGAQRSVELEEAALPVDDTDAAINRKAESYARRKGVSFEVALEAVLAEEVA